MTTKTDYEKAREELRVASFNWQTENDPEMFQEAGKSLHDTTIAYRDAAEARIKDLEKGKRLSALILDYDYPCDFFLALIRKNSPYAFYLFQWVPYQTEANRYRLKLQHDVKTFDGREAFGIWPNGESCGPFKDHEVEFIRISKKQFDHEWEQPK